MDANMQQVSVFKIDWSLDTSITQHQIYTACKQFGVIVEWRASFIILISFVRSIHTDRLKPNHQLRIDNEEFDLKWVRDDLPIRPHQQLPELEYNQQTPQETLYTLLYDCLLEIFVKLPVVDRCAVAHVCQRFRNVVLGIKPKHIEINDVFCTDPLWKIERFFRIFGRSIQTAHITECPFRDIVLVFLSRYCENLVEVNCAVWVESSTITEVAALFPRLRRVRLDHGSTSDIVFQPNDEVESIRVGRVAHLPPIHFPKLRELQFRIVQVDILSLERFFALNSQIEKLHIYMDDCPMSIILANLSRLQELFIEHIVLNDDGIGAICQSRQLHTLGFGQISGDVASMLRAFVENGIQLKRLKIFNHRFDYSYDVDLLIRMKCLQNLEIKSFHLNDDQLVQVVGNCTNLKEIEIRSSIITPRGIRDALWCAISLEKITFKVGFEDCDIIVDQSNEIDAIGELRATKRIDIQAEFFVGAISSEMQGILDRHSDWVRITVRE